MGNENNGNALTVYRYMSCDYALEAIQTGMWKLGRLHELNDPFDCFPNITGVPEVAGVPLPETYSKYTSGVMDNFTAQFAVICFSKNISDPALWGHYGDSLRGIALGFEIDPLDQGEISEVEYLKKNKRATISYDDVESARTHYAPRDLSNNNKALDRILKGGFNAKSSSWAWEEEYRAFVDINKPQWSASIEMRGRHVFAKFPTWARLSDIVIGAKCPIRHDNIGRSCTSKIADNIRVWKTEISREKFEIEKTRIFTKTSP